MRDTYGGASIFYYGGGGQGNHLCGSYGASTRHALGSVFSSNALAQEKTGEFWVDHKLFGTGLSGSYQQAEVAVFVGKNPWQSHGFQRARPILRDIAADPNRALIVIDPRRTETADMADYHLRVRPGTDAFCLAAILGVLVQEDLIKQDFIRDRTQNSDELFATLNGVPVADYLRARRRRPRLWFATWRAESPALRAFRFTKTSASSSRSTARSTPTWKNFSSP